MQRSPLPSQRERFSILLFIIIRAGRGSGKQRKRWRRKLLQLVLAETGPSLCEPSRTRMPKRMELRQLPILFQRDHLSLPGRLRFRKAISSRTDGVRSSLRLFRHRGLLPIASAGTAKRPGETAPHLLSSVSSTGLHASSHHVSSAHLLSVHDASARLLPACNSTDIASCHLLSTGYHDDKTAPATT